MTVPSGAEATVEEVADGIFNVTNSGDSGTITVKYQGQETELDPGQSMIVQDTDNDGVSDAVDLCAGTPLGEIVDANGCSIDQLCPCEAEPPWKNHGKYVSCVAKAAESFMEHGLITEAEKDQIVSGATKSDCGKKK